MGKTRYNNDESDYFPDTISPITKASKKIKKETFDEKKYKTFNDETKDNVLLFIQQALCKFYNLKNPSFIDKALLRDLIDKTHPNDYNQMIGSAFGKNGLEVPKDKQEYTQQRKKIKNWIKGSGKAETRGGVAVPEDIKDEFKEDVILALKTMNYRQFDVLREKILPRLESLRTRKNYANKEGMCSKHWWFDYLNDNGDVKVMWETIPRHRGTNKAKNTTATKSKKTANNSRYLRKEEEESYETSEVSESALSTQASPSRQESDHSSQYIVNETQKEYVKHEEAFMNFNSDHSTGEGLESGYIQGFNEEDNHFLASGMTITYSNEGYINNQEQDFAFLDFNGVGTDVNNCEVDQFFSNEISCEPSQQDQQEKDFFSENTLSTNGNHSLIDSMNSPTTSYTASTYQENYIKPVKTYSQYENNQYNNYNGQINQYLIVPSQTNKLFDMRSPVNGNFRNDVADLFISYSENQNEELNQMSQVYGNFPAIY